MIFKRHFSYCSQKCLCLCIVIFEVDIKWLQATESMRAEELIKVGHVAPALVCFGADGKT